MGFILDLQIYLILNNMSIGKACPQNLTDSQMIIVMLLIADNSNT